MSSEIYKAADSLTVSCKEAKVIEGVTVPKDHPFRNGHLLSVVSIQSDAPVAEHSQVSKDRLVQVSPFHRRSYELRFGENKNVFWQDKYGNLYSTLTTKGNNLEYPAVEPSESYPNGFYVNGLQDSELVRRAILASQILRKARVETEMIVKVVEPVELPFRNFELTVPVSDFKKALYLEGGGILDEGDNIRNFSKNIQFMRFLITVRGLQVSERVIDLLYAQSNEDIKEIFKRVFTFVNFNETLKEKSDKSYKARHFDKDKPEDITSYMADYLPTKIGTNLAKIHNLELIHKYPYPGNLSLAGGIYDLDSVTGEALGDEPVNRTQKALDIDEVFNGGASVPGVGTILTEMVRRKFIPPIGKEFMTNFIDTYNKTSKNPEPIDEAESVLEFLELAKQAS